MSRQKDPEQERRRQAERDAEARHVVPDPIVEPPCPRAEIYLTTDNEIFYNYDGRTPSTTPSTSNTMKSLDELLERDKLREKDGFPRKIRLGKLIRPGKGGKDKIVVVPTATEEKFYHDNRIPDENEGEDDGEGGGNGGAGEGEEGEIIGEEPIHTPDGTGQGGAGSGEGGDHEIGSDAYQLGKLLTEKFQLPNLKDKGKKRSLTRYNYDLTDRHRGEGQIIDKKATLKQILKTNIGLEFIKPGDEIDPTQLLVHGGDMIYRVLSKEQDYESQAIVFFVRDYSGSMYGTPTEIIVSQHVMIYSWLMYQYQNQVETRFFVHDTEAKEVPDFYTYSNSTVAGGTKVASALRLVHEVVQEENLARDYNIYIFYGGDGDDWDSDGKESCELLRQMVHYANRIGFVVARTSSSASNLERYLQKSGVLEEFPKLIKLDAIAAPADEDRIVESIKRVIEQHGTY